MFSQVRQRIGHENFMLAKSNLYYGAQDICDRIEYGGGRSNNRERSMAREERQTLSTGWGRICHSIELEIPP